mmetsp:Transcript_13583/g.23284  ORF Transcript_13583/g.23284 Transcript_13583/m.23284 type:complete len:249 (-) Transcript_13583:383-1129(-)
MSTCTMKSVSALSQALLTVDPHSLCSNATGEDKLFCDSFPSCSWLPSQSNLYLHAEHKSDSSEPFDFFTAETYQPFRYEISCTNPKLYSFASESEPSRKGRSSMDKRLAELDEHQSHLSALSRTVLSAKNSSLVEFLDKFDDPSWGADWSEDCEGSQDWSEHCEDFEDPCSSLSTSPAGSVSAEQLDTLILKAVQSDSVSSNSRTSDSELCSPSRRFDRCNSFTDHPNQVRFLSIRSRSCSKLDRALF